MTQEFGDIVFCGGDETCDLDTALAFVRFVRALPPERIHPDDVEENCTADVPAVRAAPSLDNPPIPYGWQPMPPSKVTPEVGAWATMIQNDPITYPMFSSVRVSPARSSVLARVEWVPNSSGAQATRGVTLYEPDEKIDR